MRRLRDTVLGLTALACAVAFCLATGIAEPLDPLPFDPFWLAFIGLPVVGAFISMRRPGNAVGGVVLGIGVAAAASAGANVASVAGLAPPDLLVLMNQLAFIPIFFLLPLFFLIFPDGRLPSPRWKLPVMSAFVISLFLAAWFALRPVEYSFDNITFYPNPWALGALAAYDDAVVTTIQSAMTVFGAASLLQAIISYRKAGQLRRLQVKWVLVPAISSAALFAAGIVLEALFGPRFGDMAVIAAIVGGGNFVAVGIGLAVLRHNLFEIERIISRTVTYSLIVGSLGLLILGLVAGMALFVPSNDPLVVAASTLAVFTLFNPLRRLVQRTVEQRFNRSRFDAQRVVEEFVGDLQDRVELDQVVEEWVEIVDSTMQPAAVGVWIK
jgi:hypothetical protein